MYCVYKCCPFTALNPPVPEVLLIVSTDHPPHSLMMFSKLTAILSISLLTATLSFGMNSDEKYRSCSVANATITFPPGQTALVVPPGQVPSHIFFGKGVQNYTCSDTGTYTYAPGHESIQQAANCTIM
jgi:hypothetical protein